MAAASSKDAVGKSVSTSCQSQPSKERRGVLQQQHTIDIMFFLAAIASGMIIAFVAGVSLEIPSFPHSADLQTADVDKIEASDAPNPRPMLAYENTQRVPTHEKYVTTASEAVASRMNSSSFVTPDEHHPAGQHLLVDIRGVNADFLNSEEHLALAMVEAVDSAQLTLLSYHCHSLEPAGVSCVGVLLESHISFHTWPDEGVITLDLFTCGSNPLVPVVPALERLFGVPRGNANDTSQVHTRWSHELRGFRSDEAKKAHYLDASADLPWWVTSPLEVVSKREVASIQTEYQRIDIWDVVDTEQTPSYDDILRHGLEAGDPRLITPELASPDRWFFLDGKLQSSRDADEAQHEALVHPAMFAHPRPKRVAIIGGGEGATLREVLKHKTVEKVKMIEIDPMMIEVARQYLPYCNDCSDFVGVADNCFDDPRAEIIHEDGSDWFLKSFSSETDHKEKFEVIIFDALNPEDEKPTSRRLFTSADFLSAVLESLVDDGVIVINAGVAPTINDPAPDKGMYAQREHLFKTLEGHPDVKAMLVYEESRAGFNEPHSFLLICKSHSCRKQWHAGADAVDFEIYERISTTHSTKQALKHFDGSTQYSYQFPSKAWETVYCRRDPTPQECAFRGLDMGAELHDLSPDATSPLKVEKTEDGVVGVFATRHIKKGDYIMPTDLASSFIIAAESTMNLVGSKEVIGTGNTVVLDNFLKFVEKHGHESVATGAGQTIVEVGGTSLIRVVQSAQQANVGRMVPKPEAMPTFSPVFERFRRTFDVFLVATKDINKGEEILKYDGLWS